MHNYEEFTKRNGDYITTNEQDIIKNSKILIAGCGIGSYIAECLLRVGFEKLSLIDHDTVEQHNLNRQNFTASDIDKYKVTSLSRRLREINPNAKINFYNEPLSEKNVEKLVDSHDFIIDSIDFIDLNAIVCLHDEAKKKKKHVISALNMGLGAGIFYFSPEGEESFRELFGIKKTDNVSSLCYATIMKNIIKKFSHQINKDVYNSAIKTFNSMINKTPCPASQVAPGSMLTGSLTCTAIIQLIKGKEVRKAPNLISVDLASYMEATQ